MKSSPFAFFLKMLFYFAKKHIMRKLLHFTLFISITILSCSLFSSDLPIEETSDVAPCPLDTCQKISIELSIQGLNYAAKFTCYEWTDWGTGMEVDWKDNGRILFFTFPNHRICSSEFRICAEDICDCVWQTIKGCPRNNTLTVGLDSCLFGQSTLFLDVYLVDNE